MGAQPSGGGVHLPPPPPAGQTVAARASRVAAADDPFPWHRVVDIQRSAQGRNAGVYFARSEGAVRVLKHSATPGQELLAARLAALVGLRGPRVQVETRLPAQVMARIGARGGHKAIVLNMEMVDGRSFSELTELDIAAVLGDRATGAPGQLAEMGRVLALDALLQNPDRFLCLGSECTNTGNLMLDRHGLQVIDSTFPRYFTELGVSQHRQRLAAALTLLVDPADTQGDRHLRGIVEFFPPEWGVEWSAVRDEVVAGFAAGARQIAGLDKDALNRCFREAERLERLPSGLKEALRGHIAVFSRAHLASQSGAQPLGKGGRDT